jgi:hypothetical protein
VLQLALVITCIACFTGAASARDSTLLAPSKSIAGASQEEWSRRWWQWAGSFDDDDSPVADTTGRFCASGQRGQVWFLAGTYETRRTERTCKVPRGRTLFFPLINTMMVASEEGGSSCKELAASAATFTRNPSALVLEVDGVRFQGLKAHRQVTRRCFSPRDGEPYIAAGNGYYVAIAPLPPGVHTLSFGGILPELSQAITYTLIVE